MSVKETSRARLTLGRALKWIAGAIAAAGLLVAATGALRIGALAFASSVALFGAGGLLEGTQDRAVGRVMLIVGLLSVLGVVGHLLTGL